MIILGIETSCDETSAAIIEKKGDQLILRSNVVASSLAIHAKTGGVIPENAAREQIKYILPVIKQALNTAFDTLNNIDALAVTYGPGLIGSLLVGVETAKTLAYVLDKPLIPVNHMLGHIYANWLRAESEEQRAKPYALSAMPNTEIQFPTVALIVSGGHTDLLLLKNHGDFKLLGGTRDDAAGEAFDKIGRLLGLAYPAGAEIEKRAKLGDPKRFDFPRPLVGSPDYDFSFSGLKTAVLREVTLLRHPERSEGSYNHKDSSSATQNDIDDETVNDLCAGVQKAIVSVLIKKTLKAAKEYNVKSILLSGGVAANETLRQQFELDARRYTLDAKIFAPQKSLCTDNAAMIAAAAAFNYHPEKWDTITANPELYY